eukprot:CAMPEP_0172912160 /NCGR_PEP_ID=MMETSP1075-20121228/187884_1 /TAXON_ID=2916 /ORGANISM="Ceratium fusus, Strain PA161109" /LENGTH=45 /DNA_ID= /DNA_START= /DNA_END= /DNA_ORIENTATION=
MTPSLHASFINGQASSLYVWSATHELLAMLPLGLLCMHRRTSGRP